MGASPLTILREDEASQRVIYGISFGNCLKEGKVVLCCVVLWR